MGNLKSLVLLALLLSLSLAVFADTSNDAATHAGPASRKLVQKVKPSEATDAKKRNHPGCVFGCCGGLAYGMCSSCCKRSRLPTWP
ncbi:hypothetical protein N665_1821s0008 [Sinapis alba]|nr:hypothetical protein N665_1821s0008 [Sinapis alba]